MFKLHKHHLSGSIHSGHFMVSRLDDDDEDNNDPADDSSESERDNANSVEIDVNNPDAVVDASNNLDLSFRVESPSNKNEQVTSWNDLDRPAKYSFKQNQYLTYYTNSYQSSDPTAGSSRDDDIAAIDATTSRASFNTPGGAGGDASGGGAAMNTPNRLHRRASTSMVRGGHCDSSSDCYSMSAALFSQESGSSASFSMSKEMAISDTRIRGYQPMEQQVIQSPTDNHLVMQRHLQPRHAVTIDTSLTKLFETMSLYYSCSLTSPKWKSFKGLKLRLKNKIRLNNLIWRTWFLQYIRGRRPPGCQFTAPAETDVHKKSETVVLEGKYWKRKEKAILDEYKKWRIFTVQKCQTHCFRPSSFDWDSRAANLASSSMYGTEYDHYYPDHDMNIAYNLDDLPPMLEEIEPSDNELYYPSSLHPLPPLPMPTLPLSSPQIPGVSLTPTTPNQQQLSGARSPATTSSGQVLTNDNVVSNTSIITHQSSHPQVQLNQHQHQTQPSLKMIEQSLPLSHHHHHHQHHSQATTIQHNSTSTPSSIITVAPNTTQPQQLTQMQVPKSLSQQQALSLKREQQQRQQQQQSLNSQNQHQQFSNQTFGSNVSIIQSGDSQTHRLNTNTSAIVSPATQVSPSTSNPRSVEWDAIEYHKLYHPFSRGGSSGSGALSTDSTQARTSAISPPLSHLQQQQAQHQQQLSSPEQSISAGSDHLYSVDTGSSGVGLFGGEASGHGGSRGTEQRRACHINAEQKRRCNIKNGFDTLKSILPTINPSVNVKISKASMLQKAALYISALSTEQKHQADEQAVLKQQIEQVKQTIQAYQNQLPASGGPLGCQSSSHARDMLQDYVKRRTLENWKFWIFSLIIEPLFETYYNSVSTTSFADSCKTISHWLDRNCGLVSLRKEALDSLTFLSTSTNILNTPQTLPTEAIDAVRYHQNSGTLQQVDPTSIHLQNYHQQQQQIQSQQLQQQLQHQQQQQHQASVSAALAASNSTSTHANLYMN